MKGLLLLNLGTPKEPTAEAVRPYLREFLSDPRVLDMNALGRWLLLNLIILPNRPEESAEAYQKVWTDRGSPLLFHTQDLGSLVQTELGDDWMVRIAMRYGQPAIEQTCDEMLRAGVNRLVVFPLYPQYASATTGSTLEVIYQWAAKQINIPSISVVPPFYDDSEFISTLAQLSKPLLDELQPDHILFSYHGLPERQLRKADPGGVTCLKSDNCCDSLKTDNLNCYRAQCYATSRALMAALHLNPHSVTTTFQSRLGKTPWIQPYTDATLEKLGAEGKKRIAVFSPAFVADCLETLEELAMAGQEQFRDAGGGQLKLIPSLNAHPRWAQAICSLVQKSCSW